MVKAADGHTDIHAFTYIHSKIFTGIPLAPVVYHVSAGFVYPLSSLVLITSHTPSQAPYLFTAMFIPDPSP